jgi:hypothetical protein
MDPNDSSIPGLQEVRRSPFSFEVIDEKPNRQLFENSVLIDDPVVEAERNDPDRLFSADDKQHTHDQPNLAIIHETAKHRIIVYLKAQGLSNREIAVKTGFTEPWVSQLTRQPWFRLRLVTELKDAGLDAIQLALKSSALDSVFTLIDIRDDAQAPKAVRVASANSLLDRFLGKATQTIQHEEKKLPKTSEISALDQQIADIDKQINHNQTAETVK